MEYGNLLFNAGGHPKNPRLNTILKYSMEWTISNRSVNVLLMADPWTGSAGWFGVADINDSF